jgi:endonuclease/exonuclease/phosphatase family metal-dependent hydrolase
VADLKVMTRNVYVGTEFQPLLDAATFEETLAAIPEVYREILASDFEERSEGIADEIAAARPDVIGVQEAVRLLSGPPEEEPTKEVLDYLGLLQAAMHRRGLDYGPVGDVWNIDATMPSGFPPTESLRITDRGVLMVRPGIDVSDVRTGTYEARAEMEVGGGSVPFQRGWISARIGLDGQEALLVTTHLETNQFPEAQEAQARELLAGPASSGLPTIVTGDLNAQATYAPAYRALIDAGFVDAWVAAHGDDPGLTCCQDADLRTPESKLYERIDLVLLRGGWSVGEVTRTGFDPSARRPSGLWPSDHAGVVATVQLVGD